MNLFETIVMIVRHIVDSHVRSVMQANVVTLSDVAAFHKHFEHRGRDMGGFYDFPIREFIEGLQFENRETFEAFRRTVEPMIPSVAAERSRRGNQGAATPQMDQVVIDALDRKERDYPAVEIPCSVFFVLAPS